MASTTDQPHATAAHPPPVPSREVVGGVAPPSSPVGALSGVPELDAQFSAVAAAVSKGLNKKKITETTGSTGGDSGPNFPNESCPSSEQCPAPAPATPGADEKETVVAVIASQDVPAVVQEGGGAEAAAVEVSTQQTRPSSSPSPDAAARTAAEKEETSTQPTKSSELIPAGHERAVAENATVFAGVEAEGGRAAAAAQTAAAASATDPDPTAPPSRGGVEVEAETDAEAVERVAGPNNVVIETDDIETPVDDEKERSPAATATVSAGATGATAPAFGSPETPTGEEEAETKEVETVPEAAAAAEVTDTAVDEVAREAELDEAFPCAPADNGSVPPAGSTPDEAETDRPAPVDGGDQPSAVADVAAALASDSSESPSIETDAQMEAEVVEAVTKPTNVPDVSDTVDEVSLPVELEEAATAHTDEESVKPQGSSPGETGTDILPLVDEDAQPPTDDNVTAAPTPDSPESPAAEEEVEAKVVEAVTGSNTAPDVADAVGGVAIPVEMNRASATVPADEQTTEPQGSTPGETEMNIKAPVDGEKQPSAENDMAAPDFPESSASSPEEEGVKAKVAEADTKPAVVSGVKDTVVEVVVPVELDEAVSVPAGKESAVPEGSTPDDTETDMPDPVDEEDQSPADENVGVAPTPDSPESKSVGQEAEAKVLEAAAEPFAVLDSTNAGVVIPVESDEGSDTDVLSDNKLDETENGMPALVDEGGQPPTKGDATAAAPTPDSLESPSAQEVMDAKEGETTLEPATADQAAVSFELDKDAPSVTAEVSEDNDPHETNSKALVDDKDQPPAQGDVYVAAAPTPEVPSAAEEEEVEVNVMEGVTELAGVAGVADTLDDVEVLIEDEAAAFAPADVSEKQPSDATENGVKALVDEEDRPPVVDNADAGPTPDPPGTTLAEEEEEEEEAKKVEAVTEPVTVADVTDTVDEIGIPVELIEPAAAEDKPLTMEESPAVVPNDGASSEPPGPAAAVVDEVMNDDAAAPEQPVPVVPSPDAAVPGESQTAGTSTGIANTVRATTTVEKAGTQGLPASAAGSSEAVEVVTMSASDENDAATSVEDDGTPAVADDACAEEPAETVVEEEGSPDAGPTEDNSAGELADEPTEQPAGNRDDEGVAEAETIGVVEGEVAVAPNKEVADAAIVKEEHSDKTVDETMPDVEEDGEAPPAETQASEACTIPESAAAAATTAVPVVENVTAGGETPASPKERAAVPEPVAVVDGVGDDATAATVAAADGVPADEPSVATADSSVVAESTEIDAEPPAIGGTKEESPEEPAAIVIPPEETSCAATDTPAAATAATATPSPTASAPTEVAAEDAAPIVAGAAKDVPAEEPTDIVVSEETAPTEEKEDHAEPVEAVEDEQTVTSTKEEVAEADAPKAVTDASAAVVQNGEVPPADASPASEEMDVTDAVAAVDPVTEDTPRAVIGTEGMTADEPADEVVAEKPAAEKSAAEEPVAEEPATEETVAEETVAEETVAEETVAEETAVEEAAADFVFVEAENGSSEKEGATKLAVAAVEAEVDAVEEPIVATTDEREDAHVVPVEEDLASTVVDAPDKVAEDLEKAMQEFVGDVVDPAVEDAVSAIVPNEGETASEDVIAADHMPTAEAEDPVSAGVIIEGDAPAVSCSVVSAADGAVDASVAAAAASPEPPTVAPVEAVAEDEAPVVAAAAKKVTTDELTDIVVTAETAAGAGGEGTAEIADVKPTVATAKEEIAEAAPVERGVASASVEAPPQVAEGSESANSDSVHVPVAVVDAIVEEEASAAAPVEEAPTVQDDTPDVAHSVEEAIEPLAVAVAVEAETGVVEEEGVGDVDDAIKAGDAPAQAAEGIERAIPETVGDVVDLVVEEDASAAVDEEPAAIDGTAVTDEAGEPGPTAVAEALGTAEVDAEDERYATLINGASAPAPDASAEPLTSMPVPAKEGPPAVDVEGLTTEELAGIFASPEAVAIEMAEEENKEAEEEEEEENRAEPAKAVAETPTVTIADEQVAEAIEDGATAPASASWPVEDGETSVEAAEELKGEEPANVVTLAEAAAIEEAEVTIATQEITEAAKAGATAPNADASTEPPASAPTEEESPPVVAAEEVKAEEPRGIVAPATPVAIEEAEEEEFGTQPTESVGQGPAVTINKEGVTEAEDGATCPVADTSLEPPASAPLEDEGSPVVAAEGEKEEAQTDMVTSAEAAVIDEAEKEENHAESAEAVEAEPTVAITTEEVAEAAEDEMAAQVADASLEQPASAPVEDGETSVAAAVKVTSEMSVVAPAEATAFDKVKEKENHGEPAEAIEETPTVMTDKKDVAEAAEDGARELAVHVLPESPASVPVDEEETPMVAADDVKAEEPAKVVAVAEAAAVEEAEKEVDHTERAETAQETPAAATALEEVAEVALMVEGMADKVAVEVPAAVEEDAAATPAETPSSDVSCIPEPVSDTVEPVVEDEARAVVATEEAPVQKLASTQCAMSPLVDDSGKIEGVVSAAEPPTEKVAASASASACPSPSASPSASASDAGATPTASRGGGGFGFGNLFRHCFFNKDFERSVKKEKKIMKGNPTSAESHAYAKPAAAKGCERQDGGGADKCIGGKDKMKFLAGAASEVETEVRRGGGGVGGRASTSGWPRCLTRSIAPSAPSTVQLAVLAALMLMCGWIFYMGTGGKSVR